MPSCTVILRNKNRKKLLTHPIPPPFLVSLIYIQAPNFYSRISSSSTKFCPSRSIRLRTGVSIRGSEGQSPMPCFIKNCTKAISRTGENHGGFSSPPLPPLLPLLRPIRLSLTAKEWNGRLSVGAHCVQITTNHLFLWIVPRRAASIVPPLPSSSR